jgi:membrane protease YdiL (CAAX protease family)
MAQIIVANLIISGFSEELGWRGYALDRLQARWTPLVSSLILGAVHGLWHLPLFFVPGITQGEMGIASWGALLFLVVAVAGTVSYTWIYNNTQRSILSAILLHFLANLCLDVLAGLQGAPGEAYFLALAATLIVLDLILVATRRPGIARPAPHDAAGRLAHAAPVESAIQG